jgi:hypothetical protein
MGSKKLSAYITFLLGTILVITLNKEDIKFSDIIAHFQFLLLNATVC